MTKEEYLMHLNKSYNEVVAVTGKFPQEEVFNDKFIVKATVIKPFWGLVPGDVVYIVNAEHFDTNALQIYDKEKKFIAFIWDKDMLKECTDYKEQSVVEKSKTKKHDYER